MGAIILGAILGFLAYFIVRAVLTGIYTVDQNERAVLTSFGRAQRLGGTTLQDPISETLNDVEKQRYAYPQLQVIGPGGPYFKMPWQRVYKITVATQTLNIAFDPESASANNNNQVLEAVTKDQLNTGLTGQLRYTIAERNLYATLFAVKNPIAHVIFRFDPARADRELRRATDGRRDRFRGAGRHDRRTRHRAGHFDQRSSQEPA
jgi:regulator of protease activity HflC (stomatin/prohibitin superfamily)